MGIPWDGTGINCSGMGQVFICPMDNPANHIKLFISHCFPHAKKTVKKWCVTVAYAQGALRVFSTASGLP